MEILGRATNGSSIFLGGRPKEENHEVAFIHNRKAAHLGLKVESPADLLNYYQEIKARGLKQGPLYNHGFALSLFFQDPEGNVIEIYWHTGREDFAPPQFGSLELEGQTEESLRRLVAEMPSPRPLTAREEP
jgi:catechol-2,3-dioxygenase